MSRHHDNVKNYDLLYNKGYLFITFYCLIWTSHFIMGNELSG